MDKQIADAICHYLEENGVACWIAPRDVLPGSTWAGSIVKALRGCVAMVLVYSKNSNSSIQVANEVDKAFSNNKMIIPFRLDPTPLNDDFEYYLSRTHWLVAYPDYKDMLVQLLKSVKQVYPKSYQEKTVSSIEDTPVKPTEENIAEPTKSQKKEADEDRKSDILDRIQSNHSDANPESCLEPTSEINADAGNEENEVRTSSTVPPLPEPKWFRFIFTSDSEFNSYKEIIEKILRNMVYVEGGEMMLGATPEQLDWADKDEKPAHPVRLESYWICKYPVTQEEWELIMGNNPSKNKGPKLPVINISFEDSISFVQRLQTLSSVSFALPTEAQWEYAARGGVKSKGFVFAGSDDIKKVAHYFSSDGTGAQPVGKLQPNELGLYDMSGNVEEWCDDNKGAYTPEPIENPHFSYKVKGFWNSENERIAKGGSYLSRKKSCRNSYRAAYDQSTKNSDLGMRLVITQKRIRYPDKSIEKLLNPSSTKKNK